MKMPACCKDDMKDRMDDGQPKTKAMLGALAAHKRGDHDADGDGDGDEDGDSEESGK